MGSLDYILHVYNLHIIYDNVGFHWIAIGDLKYGVVIRVSHQFAWECQLMAIQIWHWFLYTSSKLLSYCTKIKAKFGFMVYKYNMMHFESSSLHF